VLPSHHRLEGRQAHRAPRPAESLGQSGFCGDDRLRGRLYQGADITVANPQFRHEDASGFGPLPGCRRLGPGAALDDCPMIETVGGGHAHQHRDFAPAAGLAEDCHVAGIAAECTDILSHPMQGQDQVEHADIARFPISLRARKIGQMQIAERPDAVANRDDDDIPAARQIRSVEPPDRRCLPVIAAAMEPDHDGTFPAFADRGAPKIQGQAVLALRQPLFGRRSALQKKCVDLRRSDAEIRHLHLGGTRTVA